jgi:hypothetical protein
VRAAAARREAEDNQRNAARDDERRDECATTTHQEPLQILWYAGWRWVRSNAGATDNTH